MTSDKRNSEPDPDLTELIRRRQQGRARVLAVLLAGLVVLIFAVTLAKIRNGTV